ncbi:MAG: TRAM domain-containing protein [Candidatus Woesearchaeota archaeon]
MYGDRNDSGFRPRRVTAPVRVGDEMDVKIEAVGEKGDGVAKKDGFVLFVPNTREGDEVRVKVTRVLRRVGFAEVVGQGNDHAEEAPTDEPADEAPEEEAESEPESPQEESEEDSEDFGEEPKEDSEEEAPEDESSAEEEAPEDEEPVDEDLEEDKK